MGGKEEVPTNRNSNSFHIFFSARGPVASLKPEKPAANSQALVKSTWLSDRIIHWGNRTDHFRPLVSHEIWNNFNLYLENIYFLTLRQSN